MMYIVIIVVSYVTASSYYGVKAILATFLGRRFIIQSVNKFLRLDFYCKPSSDVRELSPITGANPPVTNGTAGNRGTPIARKNPKPCYAPE